MSVFSPICERTILLDLFPLDPDTEETVTIRVASRDWSTEPEDDPPNALYRGLLTSLTFEKNLVAPGRIRGRSIGARGAATVGNPSRDDNLPGRKLDDWRRLRWQNRRYVVRAVEVVGGVASWSSAVVLITGRIAAMSEDDGRFVLALRDRQQDFERAVQLASYQGSGGFEGGDALEGKLKPLGWGHADEVPGVMSDAVDLWVDLHTGPVEDIVAGKDRGVLLTPSVSNPPPSGDYYEDHANGRVRLGGSPNGEITFELKGDKPGGVYVDTHAGVMRRIAGTKGGLADPADFVTADFTALDTAVPAEIGLWIGTERRMVAELMDYLAGSCGGWWIFDETERLRVGRFAPPDATAETADLVLTAYDVVRGSLKRKPVEAPPHKIVGRYRRYHLAQGRNDLGGSLTDEEKQDLGEEWRSVEWSDPDVLAEWPEGDPLEVDLAVREKTAAQALVDGMGALIGRATDPLTLECGWQAWAVALNGQVWLEHAEEGLADGAAFRLIGVSGDLLSESVQIELWR